MKAVPMIFNTEMVQALLDDLKGVTRRPAKNLSFSQRVGFIVGEIAFGLGMDIRETMMNCINSKRSGCPVRKGDLIYVRETFATLGHNDYQEVSPRNRSDIHEVRFKASERDTIANCPDWEVRGYHWRPSIHMPRWASRLTLKVTDVRIETLNDLRKNKEQIRKEGFESWPQFKHVWKSIYGQSHPNDYVWVIEFEVIHKNVDEVLREMEVTA